MPQLIPFFFINQVIMTIIMLSILFVVFGVYILPAFIKLFVTRKEVNNI